MMYEKIYQNMLESYGLDGFHPNDDRLLELSRIFFQAGVKAAFNESVQIPVLFKEKTHGN